MVQEKNYIVLNNNRIVLVKDVECFCGKDYFFTAFFDGLEHYFCFANNEFTEGFYDKDLEGLVYREPSVDITEFHLETIIKKDK